MYTVIYDNEFGGGGNNSLRVECTFHLNELMEGVVAIELGGPGD